MGRPNETWEYWPAVVSKFSHKKSRYVLVQLTCDVLSSSHLIHSLTGLIVQQVWLFIKEHFLPHTLQAFIKVNLPTPHTSTIY